MRKILQEVKDKWEIERPIYKKMAEYISTQIHKALLKEGIYPRVTSREKDVASMLKKVIRKDYSAYEQIGDKAGVRVVVHFPRQIDIVEKVVYSLYKVIEKDDKSRSLNYYELGYQAIHYQIKIDKDIDRDAPPEFLDKTCELQVRTICQDVWSEMYHILAYKSELAIPNEILREIHCLSAILEVGDKSFSRINSMIQELPNHYSINLINRLEGYYYSLIGIFYDRELSIEVIENLKACYSMKELQRFNDIMSTFVTENLDKIKYVTNRYKERIIFMSQPEIFIILERLESDKYTLQEIWNKKYPADELINISIAWGMPLE